MGGKIVSLRALLWNIRLVVVDSTRLAVEADRFLAKSGNQPLNYRSAMLSLMGDLAVTVAP
ncbi:hypothetical protein [Cypionkella sp.]|uniref:hypothetical protein n=1 Tax=Cypionkella sp. TaxID=2811411 RepID=UPI00262F93FE|nr:hypothetical protein [Cypionkella sp.]